ncbi:MAG: hypothetical protein CMO01_11335 [Thalassobius sp.]|nr:hypothetical protein [Thalassovita sp.]
MDTFLKYYALDWLAMALNLFAVYLLSKGNKFGFVSFAIANLIWITLGFTLINSLGIGLGNAAFLVMNIRGYFSWNHKTATL